MTATTKLDNVLLAYQKKARTLACNPSTSPEVLAALWAQVVAYQSALVAVSNTEYAEYFLDSELDELYLLMFTAGDGLCIWCSSSYGLEIDRIVPRRLGGLDIPGNLRAICFTCHEQRHSTPEIEMLTMDPTFNLSEHPVHFWHPEPPPPHYWRMDELLEEHLDAVNQSLQLRKELDFMHRTGRTKSSNSGWSVVALEAQVRKIDQRVELLSAELSHRKGRRKGDRTRP